MHARSRAGLLYHKQGSLKYFLDQNPGLPELVNKIITY